MKTELDSLIAGGQDAWAGFYKKKLAQAISDPARFNRALEQYGPWPMYEAILITSVKKLSADALSYIITIAHAKWKDEQQELQTETLYQMRIDRMKLQSMEDGQELASKLERARRRNANRSL